MIDEELTRLILGAQQLAAPVNIEFRFSGDTVTIVAANGKARQINTAVFSKLTTTEILKLVEVHPNDRRI